MLSYQCISSDGIGLSEKMQSLLIEMGLFYSFLGVMMPTLLKPFRANFSANFKCLINVELSVHQQRWHWIV
jgi:hypothetical protein